MAFPQKLSHEIPKVFERYFANFSFYKDDELGNLFGAGLLCLQCFYVAKCQKY